MRAGAGMSSVPPWKLYTLRQIATMMGESLYCAELFCKTNHIKIERRGKRKVVSHASIERRFPDVADRIQYGGGSDPDPDNDTDSDD
jgi:hypothetical protein